VTPLTLTYGPIPRLEEALDNAKKTNDWFEAIVLTAIQLERYGFLEVREYLESCKVDSRLIEELTERKTLQPIARCLLMLEKIDKSEFNTIDTINKERNKYLHRRGNRKGKKKDYLMGTRATKTYEPLVRESLRILKEKLNAFRGYATPR
jgi:hypothetical protein